MRVKQKGFTLAPALFIIILLIISSVTYLTYVKTIGKTGNKIEASSVAKYSAETGIYQMKSELGRWRAKWFNAKDYTGQYIFSSSGTSDLTRTKDNTQRVSRLIDLRTEANKTSSSKIGAYRITIDDGYLVSGKTSTGSATQGKDAYGNQIWPDVLPSPLTAELPANTFQTQRVHRYGIRVDGYATDSWGKVMSNGQAVYAVIDVPIAAKTLTNVNNDSPSSYMLSTNGTVAGASPTDSDNGKLTIFSNQLITGPIHSNQEIDFLWKGNFDIDVNTVGNIRNSSIINNQYSAVAIKNSGANGTDYANSMISNVVKETSQTNKNEVTIYGKNFSDTNIVPTVYFGKLNNTSINWYSIGTIISKSATKIQVSTPDNTYDFIGILTTFNKTISIGMSIYRMNKDGATATVKLPSQCDANNAPSDVPIDGIMQVSDQMSFGIEKIYSGIDDYLYGTLSVNGISSNIQPYVSWYPNTGSEPSTSKNYWVTYITPYNTPHKQIKVYGNITYSGVEPKYYYEHNHKAPGKSIYNWVGNHEHKGNIFGISGLNLATNPSYLKAKNLLSVVWYDFTDHIHQMTLTSSALDTLLTATNTFFKWDSSSYTPKKQSAKESPIISPLGKGLRSEQQRQQASKILDIIGIKLLKDETGKLQAISDIPEDETNGFYVGNKDFRSTYFGMDLKYSYGSKSGNFVANNQQIWVCETINSSNYMKVSDTRPSSDFKSYTYREIPKNAPSLVETDHGPMMIDGGIIFVRDGYIKIGSYQIKPYSSAPVEDSADTFGNNTIIDGRLSIFVYSENKLDSDYETNDPGDIVITGNIIYKNRIYPYPFDKGNDTSTNNDYVKFMTAFDSSDGKSFRQYDTTLSTKTTGPDSMTDSSIAWVTKKDGDVNLNGSGYIYQDRKVNSLNLIASNDIKIPVTYYKQDKEDEYYSVDNSKKDIVEIFSQLIAGNRITQVGVSSNDDRSKNDRLIVYGSFYSNEPPNLVYFDREPTDKQSEALSCSPQKTVDVLSVDSMGRLYLFDRTLSQIALAGSPFFPPIVGTSADYDDQYIVGADLPKIVRGTWKSIPATTLTN